MLPCACKRFTTTKTPIHAEHAQYEMSIFYVSRARAGFVRNRICRVDGWGDQFSNSSLCWDSIITGDHSTIANAKQWLPASTIMCWRLTACTLTYVAFQLQRQHVRVCCGVTNVRAKNNGCILHFNFAPIDQHACACATASPSSRKILTLIVEMSQHHVWPIIKNTKNKW